MPSTAPTSIGLVQPERTEAILYFADEKGGLDLDEVREAATRMGFDIVFEVEGPDPDGSKLRDLIEGAKAGGMATTVVVPKATSLAPSTARTLEQMALVASAGMRVLSVLQPRLDSANPEFIEDLTISEEIRKSGIKRGTQKWADERKEQGIRRQRMPKCRHCGHPVVRLNGGKGHVRAPSGTIGPCYAPACGCPTYDPRNSAMMGD